MKYRLIKIPDDECFDGVEFELRDAQNKHVAYFASIADADKYVNELLNPKVVKEYY